MNRREAHDRTWLGRGTVRSLRLSTAFHIIGLALDPAKPDTEHRYTATDITHLGINNLNVTLAENFHVGLIGLYHPSTYLIYGTDTKQPSFEKVVWRVKKGLTPRGGAGPSLGDVPSLPHGGIRGEGSTPEYVGGRPEMTPTYGHGTPYVYQTSHWELHCLLQDGKGDGTVPQSSGAAPLKESKSHVRQQFRMTGFGHEPAYKNTDVQQASLFSINKIAGSAKVPA